MLKIDNLNFSYGNKKILKDFSMEVREGERVALKGSSWMWQEYTSQIDCWS